jgi:hypothetical protein
MTNSRKRPRARGDDMVKEVRAAAIAAARTGAHHEGSQD